MSKVIINIDWADRNFCAAPEDGRVACVATGRTLEETEQKIVESICFQLEGMREDGEPIPQAFQGEWDAEYRYSTRAQLRYADAFITRKALARETGINEQQLSHYANGWKTPRPATRQRILDGIRAISRRLMVVI